jgi:hypothetical protein
VVKDDLIQGELDDPFLELCKVETTQSFQRPFRRVLVAGFEGIKVIPTKHYDSLQMKLLDQDKTIIGSLQKHLVQLFPTSVPCEKLVLELLRVKPGKGERYRAPGRMMYFPFQGIETRFDDKPSTDEGILECKRPKMIFSCCV